MNHDTCLGLPAMLERIPDLTHRKLDHWTRTGRLHGHTHREGGGSGVPMFWSTEEAAITDRIVRLQACGFTLDAAVALARGPALMNSVMDQMREIAS